MTDRKEQLAQSLKRHADLSQARFEAAHSPLMDMAWVPAPLAKPQPRDGKADGVKFWLHPSDTRELDRLKLRAALRGQFTNKSQLVRAGVHLLATLDDEQFGALVEAECAKDNARAAKR